jgi:hypothetical protein
VKFTSILLFISMLTVPAAGWASQKKPTYRSSELKRMAREAQTPEDFEHLATYCDQRAMVFQENAQKEQNELDRLLVLRFHPRIYAIQVDTTRNRLSYDKAQAKIFSDRAAAYQLRAKAIHTTPPTVAPDK